MTNKANNIDFFFSDKELITKIKEKLPKLFQLAELECSRDGKIGMQVGSIRESIVISLFIYKFGDANVNTNFPITKKEVDVEVFDELLSIKTISGSSIRGVKLIWTVDWKKAEEFVKTYRPNYGMILVWINWGSNGGFYYIPPEVQQDVVKKLGINKYIKLPKQGTNPRGIELSKEAMEMLTTDKRTKVIDICWTKSNIDYDPYQKWLEYWKEK